MNYRSTTWRRYTDGSIIVIVSDDYYQNKQTSRPLRAKRQRDEKHIWISPYRLTRQYEQIENVSLPNTKTRDRRSGRVVRPAKPIKQYRQPVAQVPPPAPEPCPNAAPNIWCKQHGWKCGDASSGLQNA